MAKSAREIEEVLLEWLNENVADCELNEQLAIPEVYPQRQRRARIEDAAQKLGIPYDARFFPSEVLERILVSKGTEPRRGAPATAKGKRTRRTPHENPESLLKGTQVTKQVAGTIFGLSDRSIRNLIEEGHLQTQGEGHRQMVTVASIRARIKGQKKSA